jgi:hypothetical protein
VYSADIHYRLSQTLFCLSVITFWHVSLSVITFWHVSFLSRRQPDFELHCYVKKHIFVCSLLCKVSPPITNGSSGNSHSSSSFTWNPVRTSLGVFAFNTLTFKIIFRSLFLSAFTIFRFTKPSSVRSTNRFFVLRQSQNRLYLLINVLSSGRRSHEWHFPFEFNDKCSAWISLLTHSFCVPCLCHSFYFWYWLYFVE